MNNLAKQHCKPHQPGVKPLSLSVIQSLMERLDPQWQLAEAGIQKRIRRIFTFTNFHETIAFINAVAWMTHTQNHYPQIIVDETSCQLSYFTNEINGLTLNDFICAAKIDLLLDQTQMTALTNTPKKTDLRETESALNAAATQTQEFDHKQEATQSASSIQSAGTASKNFRARKNARLKPETSPIPALSSKPFASEYLKNLEASSQEKPSMTPASIKTTAISTKTSKPTQENHIEKTLLLQTPGEPERTLVMLTPYIEPSESEPQLSADVDPEEQRTLIITMPILKKDLISAVTTHGQPGNHDLLKPEKKETHQDPDEIPTILYTPDEDNSSSSPEDPADQTIPEAKYLDMERTQVLLAVDRETGRPLASTPETPDSETPATPITQSPFHSSLSPIDTAIENDDTLVMYAHTFARVQQ